MKIVPVAGDVTEPELGISEEDQNLLIHCVSVVFHSAATVKFDEALKLSVTINMLGTKQLVELCHRMHNLEVRFCSYHRLFHFNCFTIMFINFFSVFFFNKVKRYTEKISCSRASKQESQYLANFYL